MSKRRKSRPAGTQPGPGGRQSGPGGRRSEGTGRRSGATGGRPASSRRPAARADRKAVTARPRPVGWISVLAVVALLAAGLIGLAIYSGQRDDDVATPASATADGTGVVDGNGPVTVEIWLDLHCPHCATFEEAAGELLDRMVADGTITRVQHPVAFLDRASTTRYSTRAAGAVGCAADAGAHPGYVRALLAAQPPSGGPGLTDDELIEVGADAGITDPGFAECVREGTYRGWTQQVTAHAAREGVTGTPTVRVNGEDVPATAEAVQAAVARARPGS
ncbi:MAG TPA: thioredoxin domain-containing protein [Natronosporangium sp.]|nr:thioredoxin domain-containing protein [Natronosporangium sp.]